MPTQLDTSPYVVTRHASNRVRQRGICSLALALLIEAADLETYVGAGCIRLELSKAAAANLILEGARRETVERAYRLTAIVSEDGALVTAYRAPGVGSLRPSAAFDEELFKTRAA